MVRTRVGLYAAIAVAGIVGLAGCADPGMQSGDPGMQTDAEVEPLAKAEGWRFDLSGDPEEQPYGLVEIADDAETAEQAWADNVPENVGEGDSDRGEPGVYGSLDDVDFASQALVVWHGGESGVCPGWLADIDFDGQTVTVERGRYSPGDGCTDDYNPYRMVLAVDRDKLPDPSDLPTEEVVIDSITNARADTYPDDVLSRG